MNYIFFIDEINKFLEQHVVLTWLILSLVVIGLIQFEKAGEAIGKCIYYIKH
jgi:hypothetical protein